MPQEAPVARCGSNTPNATALLTSGLLLNVFRVQSGESTHGLGSKAIELRARKLIRTTTIMISLAIIVRCFCTSSSARLRQLQIGPCRQAIMNKNQITPLGVAEGKPEECTAVWPSSSSGTRVRAIPEPSEGHAALKQ